MTSDRILPKRHTSMGWAVTEIGFEHVPGYDLDEAKKGLSPQSIRTELYRDWEASQNKAVFPEFNKALHVVADLVYDPHRPLFVGIDMPGTPAAVITQLDAFDRWCVLSNLSPPEDETIGYYEFGERLAEVLLRDFAEPYGRDLADLPVRFYGDPAGGAKIPRPGQSPKEARSCFDILKHGIILSRGVDERGREVIEERPGWGWHITPGEVSISKRLEALRARLTKLNRGVPAFAVHPDCRTLIEAMAGAYCYKQRSDGRYEPDPDKGFHSHTVDALSYPATRLFVPKPAEDEDGVMRREQRSRAASRRTLR